MTDPGSTMRIRTAEVVLPCADLSENLAFFGELGFRLESILPADDPAVAVVTGHGLRLRLDKHAAGDAGRIRLTAADTTGGRTLVAPNGTRVELVAPLDGLRRGLVAPADPLVIRGGDAERWKAGRAGMRYRDLLPRRPDLSVGASHIRVDGGGPVLDYVHYHEVELQLIFCHAGWVRLVYEDQGPPFALEAGDCVLQPPGIRHRVLEAAGGLEVVELSTPVGHETRTDPDLALPSAERRPDRRWSGQRFLHEAGKAGRWFRHGIPGFEGRDTGISKASGGRAAVRLVRSSSSRETGRVDHDARFYFAFLRSGSLRLHGDAVDPVELRAGDAFTTPPGWSHSLVAGPGGAEFLEVGLPGAFSLRQRAEDSAGGLRRSDVSGAAARVDR